MKSSKNLFETLCPCGCFNSFKNQDIDFIKDFKYWFLILNHEQGFLGRSILILKNHKTDEVEITDEEALEKHVIYSLWRNAIAKAFRPDKINQAQLGNEEHIHNGHIHWHFVPRYRRKICFEGVEFQSDTIDTKAMNFNFVRNKTVHPIELRIKIKEELLKYL